MEGVLQVVRGEVRGLELNLELLAHRLGLGRWGFAGFDAEVGLGRRRVNR